MRTLRMAALVGLCAGCPANLKPPGDEIMGTFSFTATPPTSNICALAEVPDGGFTFEAIFSRQKDPGTHAYITVAGANRDAMFDGQVVTSELSASRAFGACQCIPNMVVETRVVETLRVALLSAGQNLVVGPRCPTNALDGGLPGPDAGVSLPSSQPSLPFDAVRACGDLTDSIVPDGGCSCDGDGGCCPCDLVYHVEGTRK